MDEVPAACNYDYSEAQEDPKQSVERFWQRLDGRQFRGLERKGGVCLVNPEQGEENIDVFGHHKGGSSEVFLVRRVV